MHQSELNRSLYNTVIGLKIYINNYFGIPSYYTSLNYYNLKFKKKLYGNPKQSKIGYIR